MKTLIVILLLLCPVVGWGEDGKTATKEYYHSKECLKGVKTAEELMATNPYDNVGKCYMPMPMEPMQLLGKNKALYVYLGGYEPVALIEFGKKSVPMQPHVGVVKGMGAFEYTTAQGAFKVVHRVKSLLP